MHRRRKWSAWGLTAGRLALGTARERRRRRSAASPETQVRWYFLRALGLVNLVAFTSLRAQVRGLYGRRGILPLAPTVEALSQQLGPRKWREAPSLLWLGASDEALVRTLATGQLASAAMLFNVLPKLSAAAAWALYASFLELGQDFMGFQWDSLLLEANLHGMLVAPSGIRPGLGRYPPSTVSVVTMRALVARLYFESGIAKRQGGDRTWREYTALRYYYETAPLPTTLGWYAHQLPEWVQKATTFASLWGEVLGPLGSFGPRPLRLASFGAFTALQKAIAATGNYGFFNLLSGVLGLWLLDDGAIPQPLRIRRRRQRAKRPGMVRLTIDALAHAPILLFAAAELGSRWDKAPTWVRRMRRLGIRLRLVSPYGLFSAMTIERPEIVLEGSDDGKSWQEYRFRFKPDAVDKRPRFNAPHQPRLDWQLWFAALGRPPSWFPALMVRLLEGSPDVTRLLAEGPFDKRPPKLVRALLYDYRMTNPETRKQTGAWWTRRLLGTYFPAVTLSPTARPERPALRPAQVQPETRAESPS